MKGLFSDTTKYQLKRTKETIKNVAIICDQFNLLLISAFKKCKENDNWREEQKYVQRTAALVVLLGFIEHKTSKWLWPGFDMNNLAFKFL